jgi:hypothetical protein
MAVMTRVAVQQIAAAAMMMKVMLMLMEMMNGVPWKVAVACLTGQMVMAEMREVEEVVMMLQLQGVRMSEVRAAG